ncbi:tyrosine-type recombinase/integrase [Bacteroidota bacterium]
MFLSKDYKGIYYLYYNDENGKRRKISTKAKLKAGANEFLRIFKSNDKTGTEKIPKKVYKISDIERPIMEYVKSNFTKSSYEKYSLTFQNLKRFLRDSPINLINLSHIEYYKNERVKEVKKITCNIEIKTIKSIFNLCLKFNFIERNNIAGVQIYKIPQKEKLSFSETEIKLILNNIEDSTLKNIVLVGLLTGCRLDEICNIQIKDIILKDRVLMIRNKPNFKTKTGKIRNIPISDKLYSLLQSMLKDENNILNFYYPEGYLFQNKFNSKFNKDYISRSFKKVLRKLNLPEKYHFHCLRHTCISQMIKNGVNINYVKEIAGHSEISTTMNYIHIVTDDLREAVNKININ